MTRRGGTSFVFLCSSVSSRTVALAFSIYGQGCWSSIYFIFMVSFEHKGTCCPSAAERTDCGPFPGRNS